MTAQCCDAFTDLIQRNYEHRRKLAPKELMRNSSSGPFSDEIPKLRPGRDFQCLRGDHVDGQEPALLATAVRGLGLLRDPRLAGRVGSLQGGIVLFKS